MVSVSQKFEKYLAKVDFNLQAAQLVTGEFVRCGTYVVGNQTLATFGAGAIANGVDFRRIVKIDLQDLGGALSDLRVRLVITNAEETRRTIVAEELSQILVSGVALAEYAIKGNPYDKLVIEVLTNNVAPELIDVTASSVAIPTTIYA